MLDPTYIFSDSRQ